MVEETTADGDLRRPGHSGFGRAQFVALDMPENIFQHDNGIVHDQAGGKGKAAEGDGIEREPAKVEQGERRDNGNRNGQRHDEGTAETAQEEQQDDDRQRAADQGAVLHVINRCLNKPGLIVGQFPLQVRVQALHGLEFFAQVFRRLHGVRAALLHDNHAGGRGPVQARINAYFLMAVAYIGDLAERDELAVVHPDRDFGGVVRTGKFSQSANGKFRIAFFGDTGGQVNVFLNDALRHLFKRRDDRRAVCRDQRL